MTREEARSSLVRIFAGFADTREASNPQNAYRELQKRITEEAPELIALGLINMKDCVGLIASLEEHIKGGVQGGKTIEEQMREFLTAPETENSAA